MRTLRYIPYSLELKEPFGTAHGTRTHTDGMIVAVHREGKTGYGEAFIPPYYAENQDSMAELFESIDPHELLCAGELDKSIDFISYLAPGNEGAKTALDIALHDLFGKEAGVPVFELIADHDRLPVPGAKKGTGDNDRAVQYSTPTSYTIGTGPVESMVRKAIAAQEFETLKIKLTGGNDIAIIEAIRKITDQRLFVDVNQGWSDAGKAIKTSQRLVELGVGLIEQPFPKGEAEKAGKLRNEIAVPVVADEEVQSLADIERVAEHYDGVNIKLTKAGGIREARRMMKAARIRGLKVLLGCMTESSIGISAAAQLAHMADWCDLDGNLLIKNDTCRGVSTKDGRLEVTGAPGIGITDDSKLRGLFDKES